MRLLSEVLKKLTAKQEKQFQTAIKRIDRALDRYDRERPVTVTLDRNCARIVIDRLKEVYATEHSGWLVYSSETDDSLPKLEFSEPGKHYAKASQGY